MSAMDPAMMGPCENPGYSLYSQFIWSFFHGFNPRAHVRDRHGFVRIAHKASLDGLDGLRIPPYR